MKNFYLILIALLISSFSFSQVKVKTDSGRWFYLDHSANRIISLAPNLTEILYSIGAGDKLVGVSVDSDYPSAAKYLPQVGGWQSVNIEKIISLHPDLVVAWKNGNPPGALTKLRQMGIPVFITNPQHITSIVQLIYQLGILSGEQAQAQIKANKFMQQYQYLLLTYGNTGKKLRVFMQLGSNPLFTVSGHSIQNQLIELCGGINIFNTLPGAAAEVSIEGVVAKNPDVIIGLSPISLGDWKKWQQINAVKNHQLKTINGDLLSRDDSRLLQGAAQLCHILQAARQ